MGQARYSHNILSSSSSSTGDWMVAGEDANDEDDDDEDKGDMKKKNEKDSEVSKVYLANAKITKINSANITT